MPPKATHPPRRHPPLLPPRPTSYAASQFKSVAVVAAPQPLATSQELTLNQLVLGSSPSRGTSFLWDSRGFLAFRRFANRRCNIKITITAVYMFVCPCVQGRAL